MGTGGVLAADLHDYLGQLLALSRIKLSQAQKQSMEPTLEQLMTDVRAVTDQALAYIRTLVSQLSPPVLDEGGLPMALRWLAEQMQQRGLSEAQAMSLAVNGFINDLARQFPMEYSVELKRLIDLEMEGSVG